MKTSKLLAPLAAAAILLSLAATFVACSSDDSSTPGPTTHDSGTAADSSMNTDSGVVGDSGGMQDTGVIDTGSCVSDAATCNSCYSPMQNMQDPYNACAPSTANCIPFNNGTRVPANVPMVP